MLEPPNESGSWSWVGSLTMRTSLDELRHARAVKASRKDQVPPLLRAVPRCPSRRPWKFHSKLT